MAARRLLLAAALLARGVLAQDDGDDICTCKGLDFTNGGSYLIDGTSTKQFAFTSEFDSKT